MTPPPAVDPQTFWNAKILGWEDSRYGTPAAAPTLLERLAAGASASLRFRMQATLAQLTPHLPGRQVVEIGCGSGLLAERLLALGAADYAGFDISDTAIARARQRYAQSRHRPKMRFHQAAVAQLPPQGDALVFSLGLFDWLSAADIDHVFAIGREGAYLHSLSERRRDWQQLVHRLYVHLSYGHRSDGYAPRYHTLPDIAALAERHGTAPNHVYRDQRLSFCMFIGHLPTRREPTQQAPSPLVGEGQGEGGYRRQAGDNPNSESAGRL